MITAWRGHGSDEGVRGEHVPPHDPDVLGFEFAHVRSGADQGVDLFAPAHQFIDHLAAEVAGAADDEDRLGISHVVLLADS